MEENMALLEIQEQLALPTAVTREEGLKQLATTINELLNSNFQKLISILYRMDINEAKLRRLLDENRGTDAGLIIANLMIERQLQKIKSREESKSQQEHRGEEEPW